MAEGMEGQHRMPHLQKKLKDRKKVEGMMKRTGKQNQTAEKTENSGQELRNRLCRHEKKKASLWILTRWIHTFLICSLLFIYCAYFLHLPICLLSPL